MSIRQVAGCHLDLNDTGYLTSFADWNREVALALAEGDGLTLKDDHWKVIEFLRNYYTTHEIPPSPRVVIKSIGHEISPHVPCTRQQLMDLFPQGGCRQACRIAGLPDYYCTGC